MRRLLLLFHFFSLYRTMCPEPKVQGLGGGGVRMQGYQPFRVEGYRKPVVVGFESLAQVWARDTNWLGFS